MSIAERVTAHLPYLRRFARSVTGSQKSGDAYVVSTLEAMLADPSIFCARSSGHELRSIARFLRSLIQSP